MPLAEGAQLAGPIIDLLIRNGGIVGLAVALLSWRVYTLEKSLNAFAPVAMALARETDNVDEKEVAEELTYTASERFVQDSCDDEFSDDPTSGGGPSPHPCCKANGNGERKVEDA